MAGERQRQREFIVIKSPCILSAEEKKENFEDVYGARPLFFSLAFGEGKMKL
jgi:hypothetical protein